MDQDLTNQNNFFQHHPARIYEGNLFENEYLNPLPENNSTSIINNANDALLKNNATLNTKKTIQFSEDNVAIEEQKQRRKGGRITIKQMAESYKNIHLPSKELLAQKMYYPITEVASWFSVNASLLRYWEKEFDFIKPRKNKKGDRFYTVDDIAKIELIFNLLRVKKFTIEGAKEYIRFERKNKEHKNTVLKRLMVVKNNLTQLLQKIDQ